MSKIKNKNFFIVQGWMLNELNLKGNDLIIYAIIFGFSQDGNGRYTGSLSYLQDFSGSSKSTVIRSLDTLVERKLLLKKSEQKNGLTFNEYMVHPVQFDTCSPFNLTLAPGTDLTPNNYNLDNKDDNKKPEGNIFFQGDELIKKKRAEFITLLKPFLEKYGKDLCNDFWYYWTEPNAQKTKVRWELEKVFDVDARLRTFQKRQTAKQ